MFMVRLVFVFFTFIFFSGFTLSQDKTSVDSLIKNADLRKQMDSVKLSDLSERLKKSKRLDHENLGLLKQKIDIGIGIRLEKEYISKQNTKDVERVLLKFSDSSFIGFMKMISLMVPGKEREEMYISYFIENNIPPELLKKAMIVNSNMKRLKALEDILKYTDRKILEAEKWTEDEIYTPSYDFQSTFEERIDKIIKDHERMVGVEKSILDKKASGNFNKDNAVTSSEFLKFFGDLK